MLRIGTKYQKIKCSGAWIVVLWVMYIEDEFMVGGTGRYTVNGRGAAKTRNIMHLHHLVALR